MMSRMPKMRFLFAQTNDLKEEFEKNYPGFSKSKEHSFETHKNC